VHGPGSSHNPIVYHPKHGPGSSHNPIIAPVVRDHRRAGGRDHRGQQAPRRSPSCSNSNIHSPCVTDHRTRTGSRRTAWHPAGYRRGRHHPPSPTPKQRSCEEGHWSDCAPGQIRNHKPVPCLGNLC
jgi:hypothetical protein